MASTPRQTYSSNMLSKFGGQTISAPGSTIKKPTENIVWGLPKPQSPTLGSGGTQTTTPKSNVPIAPITRTDNPTNIYGVNSKNPTTGGAVPASPGATGTMAGSNAPSSQLPPAGKDYAAKLAEIQQGATNIQNSFSSYQKNQETQNSKTEKKPESEYLKYLRSMFNPEEAKRAQENVNNLNKMQSDEIARNRKEQDRIQKNEAGVIERGQTFLSQNADRASAKSLADLAIAKGYSTDILKQYTDAGASLYEAEQVAEKEANTTLSLEEAQTLGVKFGTTLGEARQMGIVPEKDGKGSINESSVFAYADMIASGQMKIENVPESYRGAVAQAVGLNGPQKMMSDYQKERITRNLNSLDDLMGQVNGWTTSFGSLLSVIPGTDARNFRADVNTLSANIAFGELTAMREASKTGGALGAVSEKELVLLESALGSLDRAQSPDQFAKSLQTIKESIERWTAAAQQYEGDEGDEGETEDGGLFNF